MENQNPKTVLFVLPNVQAGGAERVFVQLMKHFDRRAFRPILAIGQKRGAYLNDLPTDIPIYELGAERARGAVVPLSRVVRATRPDVVFSTLGMCVAAACVRPFFRKNVRFVARLGNTVSAYLAHVERGSRMSGIAARAGAWLACHGADLVIGQSDSMVRDAEQTLGLQRTKLRRIYNPIDVERVRELSVEYAPALPENAINLVAVGRLDWQKGFDVLISAMPQIIRERGDVTLTIIGDGPIKTDLLALARNLGVDKHVNLIGFKQNPYPYMRRASLLASPSRYEGFSNVILEALALGTPVVATDCPGGNREAIVDDENGWLAPSENPAGLARTLLAAIGRLPRISREAVAHRTMQRFSVSIICRDYERVMNSV